MSSAWNALFAGLRARVVPVVALAVMLPLQLRADGVERIPATVAVDRFRFVFGAYGATFALLAAFCAVLAWRLRRVERLLEGRE